MLGSSVFALGVALAGQIMSAGAQNLSFNADNFYRSDIVSVKPITFDTLYETSVKGNLFVRHNLSESTNLPAIVVGHPMGAVKEQSANLYATKLAEQGFITLSLDLPFWGESEGKPRNGVSPDVYAEAYSAAVDFLGEQRWVDRERIGALGICGSGGYVISAAKIDPRIKAIATSSMYDMGAVNRNGLEKSQTFEQRKAILDHASRRRWIEHAGGTTEYSPGIPLELSPDTDAVTAEFYDFYRTPRGEVTPKGRRRNETIARTLTTNIKFMNFYPYNDIETISPRPLLFVTGDRAHSREFSQDAYARAVEPKELYWVPNAGHVDLYDRVGLIPFQKFTSFFQAGLAKNTTN
ncbi:Alpha/Beta hydrolase protein [Aspergillus californicus]